MIITNAKHIFANRLTKNPWLGVLLTLLLIASFIPLLAQYPSATAQETCTGGNWSNIKWKSDSPNIQGGTYVGPSGFAEIEFDWKANKDAKAGDTIRLKLPQELKAVNTGTVALRDKNGEIVATGFWSGDEFTIKLTKFQNHNFNVEGSAFASVNWNTSSDFNGQLIFNGCGNGSLPGKFEQRKGGLFHDDSKIGEYIGFDEKTGNYKILWSVGIDPKEHQHDDHRVLVVDNAPEGWKFTCDGNDNNGYAPVYVSSFIGSKEQPELVRHTIYDVTGYPAGGVRNGFTNINQLENYQEGSNYTINCSPEQVSVEFPRGLSEQSAPILTLTAVTKSKPAPGSIVTNKATIDHVDVEGHVRFPNAGGLGRGSKGGFTLEKNVVGREEDKAREYSFKYECTSAKGEKSTTGQVNVKHGGFAHVSNLDKGLTCKITELEPQAEEGRKLTTSWVVIDKDDNVNSFNSTSTVTITIKDPEEEAVHLIVNNKFEPKQTGGFTLKKKVEGVKTSEKFTFKWECTTDEGAKFIGEEKLGHNEAVEIDSLPINSSCDITEIPVSIEGYTHSLRWLSNGEESGSRIPFTVIPRDRSSETPLVITAVNQYTPVVPPTKPTSSSPKPTEPTSSLPKPTKTTHAVPPIIPIPIPIPIPLPTVLPPAPTTISPSAPTPTASPKVAPSSATPKPGQNRGLLAKTGASVVWMVILAVLLAGLGGVIMHMTRTKKEK
ncbi:DUF5979 domain-containing protein [Corynebacterium pseudotuberculosis]|uniref:DUF5979 domain-containing protein n=1 Tax=Corynebacterium pseudotuberculosis TaxID=1719 RepID=UPI0024159EE4|nr:DUF5979 domain-containing protein [Corynebacterium pseudotuberculosis]WFP66263.1 DUF5979 domain-containing protein [Corynebacterium pseudotuberculosis]